MGNSEEDNLRERISWLIRLRWVAAVGVVLTVLFTEKVFKLALLVSPIYIIAVGLAIYNLVFFLSVRQIARRKLANPQRFYNWIANLQISLDLLSLAVLIHFSGGIENPFIFYFIFHVIIASILLSRRAAFLQATLAIFLFCSVMFLEYFHVLPHYCLTGFVIHVQRQHPAYMMGLSFIFASTLYIAAYMATSVANKLRENGQKLKAANELLSEKDRLKSEYVLRVTHDIKEHLSCIQTCLEPVTKGITGALNERQLDLLKRADERADKLMFFVRALLHATRIKLYQEIEVDCFSLKQTIENALGLVEGKAKDKNINIAYCLEPTVDIIKGSQIYIEETIANLLANAVKYTPNGGRIDLAVQDKDKAVVISVSDTGIGIPKDEIPRLFDEFYRARNARAVEKFGTGLGLSIAKQVVERHHGKIWVESEEGKGSKFSIELPK